MRREFSFSSSRSALRIVVWCMLFALPCGALTSALTQMLGASHFHRDVASMRATMAGWQDFRRAATAQKDTTRAVSHAMFARHHHDVGDQSVVVAAGEAGDALSGEGGTSSTVSFWQVFTRTVRLAPHVAVLTSSHWPQQAPPTLPNGYSQPLERPPRA